MVLADREVVAAASAAGLDPIGDLRSAWSGRPVLGCSTAGQAVGDALVDGVLVATVLRFEHTRVRSAATTLERSGTARRAGREIAHALDDPDLRFVLFAADGLTLNGSAIAAGVRDVLDGVEMMGVLAADGARYEHAWTFGADAPEGGSITAIGFAGDALEVGHATGSGWQPLGPERLVTSSHGDTVRELDSAAPAGLYRDYLGPLAERDDELVANCSMLPLEIRDLDDHRTVRSVRRVHADGSIVVSGDVPQGATARLLRAGADDLVHEAAVTAKGARLEDAALCFVVSAAGRRRVLGERADEEVSAVMRAMPTGTPTVACWAYGTVLRDGDRVDVHDQTICVTTVRERDARPTGAAPAAAPLAAPPAAP